MRKDKIKSTLLWWSDVIIWWAIGLPVVYYAFLIIGYGAKVAYDLNWFWFFSLLLTLLIGAVVCFLMFISMHLVFYLQKKVREKFE